MNEYWREDNLKQQLSVKLIVAYLTYVGSIRKLNMSRNCVLIEDFNFTCKG